MTHDVFLSYATKDASLAEQMCAALEAEGIRCWIAPRDVPLGSVWAESLIEAIENSEIMLLLFSVHANASPHVRRELERAASLGKPIVPVRIEVRPSKAVQFYIGDSQWLDAYTPPLERHLKTLCAHLPRLLNRLGKATTPEKPRAERTSKHTSQDDSPTAAPPPATHSEQVRASEGRVKTQDVEPRSVDDPTDLSAQDATRRGRRAGKSTFLQAQGTGKGRSSPLHTGPGSQTLAPTGVRIGSYHAGYLRARFDSLGQNRAPAPGSRAGLPPARNVTY